MLVDAAIYHTAQAILPLYVSQHSFADVHMHQLSCWSNHAFRPLHNTDTACQILSCQLLVTSAWA